MTDILNSFKHWLSTRSYQPATIRSYVQDASQFISYCQRLTPTLNIKQDRSLADFLQVDVIHRYINHLSTNNNRQRYLASLNLLCQFGINQSLISSNPIAKIRKSALKEKTVDVFSLLKKEKELFATYLSHHHFSPTTIKNYISDVDKYINWLKQATPKKIETQ